ncbi:unannotated protein [freshwater metagenome]|uniref:Unannotated protein n=1 Tax=freshwater metagenome TaxID=449393 RepID=A0A6J7IIZ7_9ZZZZ
MTNMPGLLAGACVLLLSGCAAADRQAAPLLTSSSSSPSLQASDVPRASSGSNLGSRICVENRSTLSFNGGFEEFDSADADGAMPPGAAICAEGTRLVGADVTGSLVFSDKSRGYIVRHDYNVVNPWIGKPYITFFQDNNSYDPLKKIVVGFKCLPDTGMAEGESRRWDNGILAFTVRRQSDTGWKEFRLEVTDSTDPVTGSDRTARNCTQGDYP